MLSQACLAQYTCTCTFSTDFSLMWKWGRTKSLYWCGIRLHPSSTLPIYFTLDLGRTLCLYMNMYSVLPTILNTKVYGPSASRSLWSLCIHNVGGARSFDVVSNSSQIVPTPTSPQNSKENSDVRCCTCRFYNDLCEDQMHNHGTSGSSWEEAHVGLLSMITGLLKKKHPNKRQYHSFSFTLDSLLPEDVHV